MQLDALGGAKEGKEELPMSFVRIAASADVRSTMSVTLESGTLCVPVRTENVICVDEVTESRKMG